MLFLDGCSLFTGDKDVVKGIAASNISYYKGNERFDSMNLQPKNIKAYYTFHNGKIYIRIKHDNGKHDGLGIIKFYIVGRINKKNAEKLQNVSGYLVDYRFHPAVFALRLDVKKAILKKTNNKHYILSAALYNEEGKPPKIIRKISLHKISLQKIESLSELKKMDDKWLIIGLKQSFSEY